ncbi:hypothetical protein [Alteromonas sp. H39]|uniref:hypothetical protein n=1 Tax=Alteromonas sp. H39 TaxID=3389876 RepID=UPI0039DF5409
MKKSIIALFAAAAMSAGVSAQSDNDGANSNNGLNALSGGTIATGAVTLGVLSAMVSNNRKDGEVEGPGPNPDPECSGTDPLVDGVCVGTTTTVTNTVTVSGTQTITVPITVPVTFTYAPQ